MKETKKRDLQMPCSLIVPCFTVTPVGCDTGVRRPGVPRSSSATAVQIRRAVQSAIANGKRRLCIDLLLSAVDIRERDYDSEATRDIFDALTTINTEGTHVVVGGTTTALLVSQWIKSSGNESKNNNNNTTIGILGEKSNEEAIKKKSMVMVMINNNVSRGVSNFIKVRKLLKTIDELDVNGRRTSMVWNHPRDDSLYKLAGYDGTLPVEMMKYEDVYSLAPFGVTERGNSGKQWKFVLMKQYPWKWGVWVALNKYRGRVSQGREEEFGNGHEGSNATYMLVREFEWRPDDEELQEAVGDAMDYLKENVEDNY